MSGPFKLDLSQTTKIPRAHRPLPSEDVLDAVLKVHGETDLDWVMSGLSFLYPFTAKGVGKHFRRVVAELVGGGWSLYLEGAVIAREEGSRVTLTGAPVTLGGVRLHPWASGELSLLRALVEFTPAVLWTVTDESATALEALVARWRNAGVDVTWSPSGHVIEGEPVAFSVPTPYRFQQLVGAHDHAHLVSEVRHGDGGRVVLRFKPERGAQLWLPVEAGAKAREVSQQLGHLTPDERRPAILEAINQYLPDPQTQAVWWTCLAAVQHPDTRCAGTGNQFWFTPASFLRLQGYRGKRGGGRKEATITGRIADGLRFLTQTEFELAIPGRATIWGRFLYPLDDTWIDESKPGRPSRHAISIGPSIWALVSEGLFVRVPYEALRMVGEAEGGRGGFDKLALYMALMTQARMQHGPVKRPLETVMMEAGLLRPDRMRHDRKKVEAIVAGWLAEYVTRGIAGKGTKLARGYVVFVPPDLTLQALQGIRKRLPRGGVPK